MFTHQISDVEIDDKKAHDAKAVFVPTRHLPLVDIPVFEEIAAKHPHKIVISAPHGGVFYPNELVTQSQVHLRRFRTLEDIGTSQIALSLQCDDRAVIAAKLSRAVLDLNRPAEALDPLLYDTPCQTVADNHQFAPYVAAGYGVMPRLSGEREPLYDTALPYGLATRLLERFYHPYHRALQQLTSTLPTGGVLIDLHSMPSHAAGKRMADIVFGDNFGKSLPHHYRQIIDDFMRTTPFTHGWNHPYAGGYITCHYGTSDGPHHSLQIEINRNIYLKKSTYLDPASITKITAMLEALIGTLEAQI